MHLTALRARHHKTLLDTKRPSLQDFDMSDTSWIKTTSPLPLHSGLFVAAFVCAHIAALGATYAAAAITGHSHELPAKAYGYQAVHHLGQMTLVPLHTEATQHSQ